MTKRPHDSIVALPYPAASGRHASYDADGNGSHEDGEESSLKRPRSFMATLVCHSSSSLRVITDLCRLVICVDPERRVVTKTARNVAIAGQ